MNNNEPDTLPDPAIGYIFQNDIVAFMYRTLSGKRINNTV